jgi:hypothetical protein
MGSYEAAVTDSGSSTTSSSVDRTNETVGLESQCGIPLHSLHRSSRNPDASAMRQRQKPLRRWDEKPAGQILADRHCRRWLACPVAGRSPAAAGHPGQARPGGDPPAARCCPPK